MTSLVVLGARRQEAEAEADEVGAIGGLKMDGMEEKFDPNTHIRMPDGAVVRMNRRMRLAKKSQERRLAKKGVVARSAVMVMGEEDATRSDETQMFFGPNPQAKK